MLSNIPVVFYHARLWLMVVVLLAGGAAQAGESPAEQQTSLYSAMSMGTGWALSPRHVVTNYHVVEGMHNLRLLTQDRREVPVQLVVRDQTNDLAILYIPDQHVTLKPLTLASVRPKLGAQVFTIGYPHPNLMGTNPKLTSGLISATSGLADDPRTYQVSVPVQAGNSGGPLINMQGEVVGIITSKLSAQKMFEWTGDVPQNVNYAIKATYLAALLDVIKMPEQSGGGKTRSRQALENLAEGIVESVVIVAGDGEKQVAGAKSDFLSGKDQEVTEPPQQSGTIVISAYTEPGNWDVNENIAGSNTEKVFSRNTINLLEENLKKIAKDHANAIVKVSEGDKWFYYKLEEQHYNKNLCEQYKADKILASHSEKNPGTQFRYMKFRVIDCRNLKEFHKKYRLERDQNNDRFAYETNMVISLRDFLSKLPPFIQWAAN